VFVELPKFLNGTRQPGSQPALSSVMLRKMAVLWLRYLTEIDEDTHEVPAELLEAPDVRHALDLVEQSAYSDAEMEAYDKFWDAIRVEQAFVDEAEIRYGIGRAEGREEGRAEGRMDIVRKMKAKGLSAEDIADLTGLTPEEIASV
jgi:predicted transposase/invertase (TIGR01784 family)